MQADPNYTPGQTWWDKLWGTIGSWWRNIPKWQKALDGAIFIVVSIGIAIATCGASLGAEAALLGGTTAVASVAKVALIEISIGIGFAVAGWAINAADTGDWSIGGLEDAVADSIFFTGLFFFISTSVSALKYAYRCNHYTTSKTGNTRGNIVGSTHDTIKPTQDYVLGRQLIVMFRKYGVETHCRLFRWRKLIRDYLYLTVITDMWLAN